MGTTIASALAAGVLAVAGLLGSGSSAQTSRTAVVVDARLARDGRELIDPRLRALDAEIRIPRTAAEAETDLRYFAAQGCRLVVAGPDSKAAAEALGLRAAALPR